MQNGRDYVNESVFSGGEHFEEKYVIEKLLGKGGMGEVYLARHLFTDQQVAIKVLPLRRTADDAFRLRMRREAAAGTRVSHASLVQVRDGGITADNVVYVVMEYLGEHRTLREFIYTFAPLPPLQWLGFGIQIAEGLAVCHAAQVWHRDVKPENVLVLPAGKIKVIDFGLARIRTEALRTTGLSKDEKGRPRTFATPLYASPEQLFPDQYEISEKTDVWSLATVLYEMAVGKHLWQKVTNEFPNAAEASYAMATRQPPTLRDALPRLPQELSDVVARCHQKDPALRPTAAELARDLAGWVTWAQREPPRGILLPPGATTDPMSSNRPIASPLPPGARPPELALASSAQSRGLVDLVEAVQRDDTEKRIVPESFAALYVADAAQAAPLVHDTEPTPPLEEPVDPDAFAQTELYQRRPPVVAPRVAEAPDVPTGDVTHATTLPEGGRVPTKRSIAAGLAISLGIVLAASAGIVLFGKRRAPDVEAAAAPTTSVNLVAENTAIPLTQAAEPTSQAERMPAPPSASATAALPTATPGPKPSPSPTMPAVTAPGSTHATATARPTSVAPAAPTSRSISPDWFLSTDRNAPPAASSAKPDPFSKPGW